MLHIASQITDYDSWVTWTGWANPVPESHEQILHNNQEAGRAAQTLPETPNWTSLPPSSYGADALLDLRADSEIPLKQRRKRSSKSSPGRKPRKRKHNQEYNTLPEVTGWNGLWQEGAPLDVAGSLDEGYDGQRFEASAKAFSGPRRASWDEEQSEEPALTDSEAEMAAALLCAIHGDT